MRIFRWLVVVSAVTGAIVGAVELYFALFVSPWSFASSAGRAAESPRASYLGRRLSP